MRIMRNADIGRRPDIRIFLFFIKKIEFFSKQLFSNAGKYDIIDKNDFREGAFMEHDGHRDRLRKRYEREGLDHFELHNLIEFLLFNVIPRRDTNEIAHRLVDRYQTLSAILDAPVDELRQIDGIGEQAACFLHMIPQLCRLYLSDLQDHSHTFTRSDQICNYISARLIGYDHEVVYLMLLSYAGHLRYGDIIAEGNLNSSNFSIQKLLSICTRYKSSTAILAHNHPNGIALPSQEDIDTTIRAAKVLKVSGIQLLDHIIVADGDCVSFQQSDYMKQINHAIEKSIPL